MEKEILMPCVVCKFPVDIGKAREALYKKGEPLPDPKMKCIAICSNPNCQRLVKEAIDESGFIARGRGI